MLTFLFYIYLIYVGIRSYKNTITAYNSDIPQELLKKEELKNYPWVPYLILVPTTLTLNFIFGPLFIIGDFLNWKKKNNEQK